MAPVLGWVLLLQANGQASDVEVMIDKGGGNLDKNINL